MSIAATHTLPFTTVKILENQFAATPECSTRTGAADEKSFPPNDAGRAERFVDRYVDQVRYVPAWGKWLTWDQHRWRPDGDGAARRLAIEHGKQRVLAAAQIADHIQQREAIKAALALGNTNKIDAMLSLAAVDERAVLRQEELDRDPDLLGVPNGVVDLRTRELRPGQRADMITKCAGVAYDKDATCPRWLDFVCEVTCGDHQLAQYLQCFIGYSLTGHTDEQCFAFLYGGGANGKSTLIETLQGLFGDYAMSAPLSLIALSPNGREPTHDLASLEGSRLVVGPELEQGMRLAESRIKDLTGGDIISARRLYQESFNFQPACKLWLFGNHKPAITGTDLGIWRRVRLIPFTAKIPVERRDPQLRSKLVAELPGILNWALEGVRMWRAGRLVSPAAVLAAVADYRSEEDLLGEFLEDEVQQCPSGRASFADLYQRYRGWAARNGVRHPQTSRALAKALRERGYVDGRSNGVTIWTNISLRAWQSPPLGASAASA